jgi:hypothetical protein
MIDSLRHRMRARASLFASVLMFVLIAMQSAVTVHRTVHGSHASVSQGEMAWLHAAHDHDHDDHRHEHAVDPWGHQEATDCDRFDASLSANPPTAQLYADATMRVQRAEVSRSYAAAVVLRAQRARVRDPPPV